MTCSKRVQSLIGLGAGVLLASVFGLPGCQRPADTPSPAEDTPAGPAWFEEVTDAAGLNFVHQAGPTGKFFFPQIAGSGAALFDFDGDGRLDLYLVQNAGPESQVSNRLYHQTADGHFEDVSAGSGLDVTGWGMGVAVGDIDNDGRPDVLLTEYGRCRLFRNDGKGRFTEAGTALFPGNPFWATSACFFDYDRDGWLDLVITNYVAYDPSHGCSDVTGRPDFCGPTAYQGTVTKLYHNLGKGPDGRWRGFKDVTVESGLGGLRGPGLGVVCADFDGDRWPDIFVANDQKPNHLWINQRNGTFREEGVLRGLAFDGAAQAFSNMGIALGDIDGDGLFDIYVTHLNQETNTLWQQGPKRGLFRDRTAAWGLMATRWRGTGFGTVFADFDLDGALDLAIANGAVYRTARPATAADQGNFWARYAERNQLLVNDGAGHFEDVSLQNPAFCGRAEVSRALAVGDVFNRGSLDLLVTQIAGKARLFRNVAPRRGHWLVISALDPGCGGRDAYGADVTVTVGRRSWRRWLNPGHSYLTSNDPRVHFGLGDAERVDTIQVRWPDGTEETFPGTVADQWLRLEKGRAGKSDSRRDGSK
jgi:hypothetical protein